MTSIFKRKGRKGYTVEYRDPESMRLRQRKFDNKTDAQMFDEHIRAKLRLADGLEVDFRFESYAAKWLKDTRAVVREGTMGGYDSMFRAHLVPAFGSMYLRAITPKIVRDFIVELRGRLAKKTVGNIRAALHACLQAAVEEGVLRSNPASFGSRSRLLNLTTTPGEHRGKVKAFTEREARRFLAAAVEVAPRHSLLFRTMVMTGLRPGEAIALQPRDLDFRACRIRLERAITPRRKIEPCKTNAAGEWETVDMPGTLADELRGWITAEGIGAADWLFPGRGGVALDTNALNDAFKRVLKRAGLPAHFTPHCLRHTYATLQLTGGEGIYYVSRQLRHSDIRMTARTYGSWLPAGDRAAASRLSSRLAVRDFPEP